MNKTNPTDAPKISVVIASGAGGDFLFRCLDSLREQVTTESAEVIVADRCGGETLARLENEYPFVIIVRTDLDHRSSVPELRLLGVKQARGDIVAVIEEHCVAPPHWLQAIRSSFQEGRPSDWAVDPKKSIRQNMLSAARTI